MISSKCIKFNPLLETNNNIQNNNLISTLHQLMKNLSLQSLLPACYIEMKITTSIETLLDFSRFTSIPVFAKRRESQPIPKDAPLYFTFFLNRTRKF